MQEILWVFEVILAVIGFILVAFTVPWILQISDLCTLNEERRCSGKRLPEGAVYHQGDPNEQFPI